MVIVVEVMANPERNLCAESGGDKDEVLSLFQGKGAPAESVDDKEEETMTEVLAHTISMLRGRNGSNSTRNLEWDALDTLSPVCPPAECYIHAGYIYLVLHTQRLCTYTLYTLCYTLADCRLQISLPDTYLSLIHI